MEGGTWSVPTLYVTVYSLQCMVKIVFRPRVLQYGLGMKRVMHGPGLNSMSRCLHFSGFHRVNLSCTPSLGTNNETPGSLYRKVWCHCSSRLFFHLSSVVGTGHYYSLLTQSSFTFTLVSYCPKPLPSVCRSYRILPPKRESTRSVLEETRRPHLLRRRRPNTEQARVWRKSSPTVPVSVVQKHRDLCVLVEAPNRVSLTTLNLF